MTPKPISKTTIGILIAVLGAFIYGVCPSATRATYADGANALFIIFILASMRAFAFTAVCLKNNHPLFANINDIKIAATNGFFQALSVIAMSLSMLYLAGPVANIIFFTYPLMLYLLLVINGEERLKFLTIIIIILTILGLTLVIDLYSETRTLNMLGVFLAFIAALAAMSRIYVLGNLLQERNPSIVGAESYLMAILFSSLILFFEAPIMPQSYEGWLWAITSGVCATLGAFCTFYSISLIGSFQFSFISKLEPIFTAIIAVLLINEVLSVTQYVGIAIVILSLAFYQSQQKQKS